MLDQMKKVFKEEAYELLSTLENSLIELEKDPSDEELIAKVFRALHTIKGSSGMFGFDVIASFTHNIENVFDLIRTGAVAINNEIINLTLLAKDQIALMLEDDFVLDNESEIKLNEIKSAFGEIGSSNKNHEIVKKNSEIKNEELSNNPGATSLYLIHFIPTDDIFNNGSNPLLVISDLRDLGICFVKAYTEKIPVIDQIDTEKCYTYWDIILITDKNINEVRDVFIFVEDNCKLNIEEITDCNELNDERINALEKILAEKASVSLDDLKPVITTEKDTKKENKTTVNVKEKGTEQKRTETKPKHNESDSNSSIRVNSEKLDTLVNLVSELVTVHARLNRVAGKLSDSELNSVAEEIERLAWDLRDNALNIRMLPIGTVFSKFQRLVRDLSQELGKEVELITNGAETELDKNVIEKLNDPLIHIIRNCIDHGIESKAVREQKGKSAVGKVILSARHSGANVLIEIKDDGAGINKDAILAKARERNLISADKELTEKEIYNLVFLPGFSTAKQVTNISGRGVGMDVVRRTIESLRGSIEIESRGSEGTSIVLKLPLTLAIIDGLLIKLGDDHFVIPLSFVNECVEIIDRKNQEINGRHVLNVRGELIPYIPLRDHFNINSGLPKIEQIVIIKEDNTKIGFVVDHVVGENQTVIKSLGNFYKDVEGVSGATILGDGTVALILDIPKLVQLAENVEKEITDK